MCPYVLYMLQDELGYATVERNMDFIICTAQMENVPNSVIMCLDKVTSLSTLFIFVFINIITLYHRHYSIHIHHHASGGNWEWDKAFTELSSITEAQNTDYWNAVKITDLDDYKIWKFSAHCEKKKKSLKLAC